MTLRLASGVALAIGITTLAFYFQLLGKAPWSPPAERHLRAMKDRDTAPPSATPLRLEDFGDLPRRVPLDARARLENRGVTVEAFVQRMLRAVDGDVHLDLTSRPASADQSFPYVVAEITPAFRRRNPGWSYDRLLEKLRPPRGGATPSERGPSRVRLTGWLLYDAAHEIRPARPRYADALAAWEVHPLTRLEIWNDERRRFEEHR